jgi:hypothetical protein
MFIVGAGGLPYGDIVNVIDAAKGAGIVEKVGIVTEPLGMRARKRTLVNKKGPADEAGPGGAMRSEAGGVAECYGAAAGSAGAVLRRS